MSHCEHVAGKIMKKNIFRTIVLHKLQLKINELTFMTLLIGFGLKS